MDTIERIVLFIIVLALVASTAGTAFASAPATSTATYTPIPDAAKCKGYYCSGKTARCRDGGRPNDIQQLRCKYSI